MSLCDTKEVGPTSKKFLETHAPSAARERWRPPSKGHSRSHRRHEPLTRDTGDPSCVVLFFGGPRSPRSDPAPLVQKLSIENKEGFSQKFYFYRNETIFLCIRSSFRSVMSCNICSILFLGNYVSVCFGITTSFVRRPERPRVCLPETRRPECDPSQKRRLQRRTVT